MGKIRVAALGDEKSEKEAKRKAEARRQTKASKKSKVEGVGLHGGERSVMVEGTDIKAEYRELVDQVESGETVAESKKAAKKKAKIRVRSKRYQEAAALVNKDKLYPLAKAIELVKQTSLTKFDGTVEAHLTLNAASYTTKDEKKDYRGSVSFPHGTGKQVRVVIADDKLLSEIEKGNLDFDILVAHPTMMPKLAKFARTLGPKGLMPNPKNGTVSDNPEKRAKELSQGQVNFKTEPANPLVHLAVGKVSFEDKKLIENIQALIEAVGKTRIIRATLTSTMGPGVKIQL